MRSLPAGPYESAISHLPRSSPAPGREHGYCGGEQAKSSIIVGVASKPLRPSYLDEGADRAEGSKVEHYRWCKGAVCILLVCSCFDDCASLKDITRLRRVDNFELQLGFLAFFFVAKELRIRA